jgi:hypothetical protein
LSLLLVNNFIFFDDGKKIFQSLSLSLSQLTFFDRKPTTPPCGFAPVAGVIYHSLDYTKAIIGRTAYFTAV